MLVCGKEKESILLSASSGRADGNLWMYEKGLREETMMKFWVIAASIGGFPVCCSSQTSASQQDRILRLNQIQVIGSHNSYHTGLAPSERKLVE
jgi:hypothetical protein